MDIILIVFKGHHFLPNTCNCHEWQSKEDKRILKASKLASWKQSKKSESFYLFICSCFKFYCAFCTDIIFFFWLGMTPNCVDWQCRMFICMEIICKLTTIVLFSEVYLRVRAQFSDYHDIYLYYDSTFCCHQKSWTNCYHKLLEGGHLILNSLFSVHYRVK